VKKLTQMLRKNEKDDRSQVLTGVLAGLLKEID